MTLSQINFKSLFLILRHLIYFIILQKKLLIKISSLLLEHI